MKEEILPCFSTIRIDTSCFSEELAPEVIYRSDNLKS
jgi:hypothetical protein